MKHENLNTEKTANSDLGVVSCCCGIKNKDYDRLKENRRMVR